MLTALACRRWWLWVSSNGYEYFQHLHYFRAFVSAYVCVCVSLYFMLENCWVVNVALKAKCKQCMTMLTKLNGSSKMWEQQLRKNMVKYVIRNILSYVNGFQIAFTCKCIAIKWVWYKSLPLKIEHKARWFT